MLSAMASFVPPTARTLPTTTPQQFSVTVSRQTSLTTTPTPKPQHSHLPQTTHATPPAPALSPLRPTVIWFRDDLRLHDHPAIHAAVSNSHSIAPLLLLPSQPTRFWCDAARDLQEQLRSRGGELHVRRVTSTVSEAVSSFTEEVGAGCVHFHTGVTRAARAEEALVERQLAKRGVKTNKFWTGALHTPGQLPFAVDSMPEDCDRFGDMTRDVGVEKPLPAPESVMGVTGVEAGVIPIGDGEGGGGERIGLARVRDYVNGKSLVEMNGGSVGVIDTKFGRLGQFLNVGCVSPRRLWHDVVEKVCEGSIRRWCAEFELTLRNFVVFLTLKTGVFPA